MTSELHNPKYYRGVFLEIKKYMEMREEGMEVKEETIPFFITFYSSPFLFTHFHSEVILVTSYI